MTFLERYKAGEHDRVWQELRALGPAVRDPRCLPDAAQVVTETLRRVRANVEQIEAGLGTIDYRCGAGDRSLGARATAPAEEWADGRDPQAEQIRGLLGLAAAQLVVANRMTGVFGARNIARVATEAALAASGAAALLEEGKTRVASPRSVFHPTVASFEHQMARFEVEAGPLPLLLKGFWRTIVGVDLTGVMHGQGANGAIQDTLCVMPPAHLADDYDDWRVGRSDAVATRFGYRFIVDAKGLQDGSFTEVLLPDAGADVRLSSGEWFLDFLRRITRADGSSALNQPGVPSELGAIAPVWLPF